MTYQLSTDQYSSDSTPVSACFLFMVVFIIIKVIVRQLSKESCPLQSRIGMTVPRKALACINSSMGWDEYIQNLLGMIITTIYSVYGLYKCLKKYNTLKYTVSITRNASRFAGFICSLYVPVCIRPFFYGGFAYVYEIDMNEYEYPAFEHYNTFTEFFTRKLKAGVRSTSEPNNTQSMCSPCDGRVLTCGKINSEFATIDCVKGRSYKLDEFMFGENMPKKEKEQNVQEVRSLINKVKARGNELFYMVIYLSPGDYHRFHSPAIHTADYRRHIVGYLSPVKPSHVNKHKDVFKNNERVNIFGRWEQGFYFESAVGATNVGSIKLDFDDDVYTNEAVPRYPYYADKSYL